ncbi:cytochrome c [Pikeienuella piscinae]|uniref:Cytochrome c n=1 Tax=Pikeienuella piscinae TaxID=2748098 RepID=A0A7L5C053_9RHOB|nr:cytochrome c [Pikeienuella piscinae]QIE55504.1 cytochrome c [Pikeienuella piscinae]
MKRTRAFIIGLGAIGAAGLTGIWLLTAPQRIDPAAFDGLSGDPARGERIFHIGGCASCHTPPGAEGEVALGGGRAFVTAFGTFHAPNISPGPEGIGGWSEEDLANAMIEGVSPQGEHYYPAFPYTSYARMALTDVVDLHAHLMTLPVSDKTSVAHEVSFPFSVRRGVGLWKRLYLSPHPVIETGDPQIERGRYLVEGPGHCSECHTPRDAFGGLKRGRWMAGGPNPDGKGSIPNITPGKGGLDWSAADIAEYLKSGFTPDYDVAGGQMADVVQNTAFLTDEDRAAIAAYLKALPPLSTQP